MAALPEEMKEILDEASEDEEKQHLLTPAAQKDIRALLQAAAEREVEALRLYEPSPFQEKYHQCRSKELLLSKGNQCGGSLTGFAEDARAVTHQDPYGKYPTKGGILVCLGYGEKHIGNVIHKYLCRWGAFDIIRDDKTGKWRTYKPWDKDKLIQGHFGDIHRVEESRPSPPLIPPRFIKGKPVWTKAGAKIFSNIFLTTGWEIMAYNSQGEYEHSQGFQADLWHIDEDVATDGWVGEAIARLSKRNGLLRWTAMPHAKTDDIVLMLERGKEEEKKTKPRTTVIYAGIDENPYLSDEVKEENKRIWRTMGDEEYLRRVEGRLVIGGLRMYPQFDKRIHDAMPKLTDAELDAEANGASVRLKIQKIMSDNKGMPPFDWCRYLMIDPGYTMAAGLFIATPPPKLGDFHVAYAELYIPNCTASIFARAFQKKWNGDPIQEFIFDFHGGRLRDIGSGIRPIERYEQEFHDLSLVCQARRHRMTPGCDDIKTREMALREMLQIRQRGLHSGYPTLFVCMDQCPNFVNEISSFRKKVIKRAGHDIITDDGDRRGAVHLVEGCEMGVAHGLQYVSPEAKKASMTSAQRVLAITRRFRNLYRASNSDSLTGINLGPRGTN